MAMNTQTDAMVCFGKVPTHGDFLRPRSDGEAVRVLEDWVQQGLYVLKNRGGNRLTDGFDEAEPFCFSFTAGETSRTLVGVLQPSRDRVGRRYPLILARELEWDAGEEWARTPGNHAAFLQAVQSLAREAATGEVDYRDLESRANGLVWSNEDSASSAREGLDEYLRQTKFREVSMQNWGYFEDTRKYLVVRNLLDAAAAFRERGMAAVGGLKMPFSGASSDGHEPSFWLMLVERLVRIPWRGASFFWSQGYTDVTGRLFLFPGRPPATAFLAMFGAAEGKSMPDVFWDVQEIGRERGVAAVLSLPAHYGDLLEDDDLTLAGLLQRLENIHED